ncbi:hypothetical protein A2303_06980 [Candidatus Falkowbacteria bacterium RIFOXYB2_FULL_47_14]|uniref:Thymidine kinase n=1 Tax=Candidatus Falkowbacteria bacterium RIFOXYA2_FULL_47_19 TaxID=1797994 RepID=A0A1F5SGN1_9BACT|nr:MAG: hypothetical protein A2227_00725 [Candidatus Falkowbacteria bacterium RIFOXYA2_FULL_47_19]OGF34898.1 MAG: hypothetical protein A2468_06685 [Candidatus Falkowbacteria bacterium RIFOXYC2_FULL_46_15]OGF43613.1 MAG: hypothetical protein A2303_06980 [Candidatus Falkowbacteria bacterium RIFOXYB2_FULL_47_14]
MELILILGPMKSGKSFELINYFAPLKYTDEKFALFHSINNVRDEAIQSRNNVVAEARKIKSIKEIVNGGYAAVGIDEIHMFPDTDAKYVAELLRWGTRVVISGLDTDYQGRMFKIIKELLELGPNTVNYKRAVCDHCRQPDAVYTQVLKDSVPIFKGLPPSIPDDGTYAYRALCRRCFKKL